jgi:LmbE family N-acetylglucosaminyl deacetylase
MFAQVVAHPDDDLLFMSPDLANGIRRGEGVTTVVLSAAEGRAGINDGHDSLTYVTQRRQGLQAAYAAMAGVRDDWRVESVRSGNANIEVRTLTGRPNVHLSFLGLPDGRDPRVSVGRRAIARLEADHRATRCAPAVTSPYSPYAHCYTHADVVSALVTLFERYRPAAVRTQDPSPDRRYTPDHTDHRAAALFTAEAVRAYGRPVIEVGYRDYNLSDTPVNLARTDRTGKQRYFATYRAHDYRISAEAGNFASWQERMRYRWPRGASWATRAGNGRLQAFAVLSGRLYTWWQTPTGWAGPASLGGEGLVPSLSTAAGQVFALRAGHLVAFRPRHTGGRWTATWTTLGPATGTPVAVAGRTGGAVVFVRDAHGGVSVTCQAPDRSWTPLRALRGPAVKIPVPRRPAPSSFPTPRTAPPSTARRTSPPASSAAPPTMPAASPSRRPHPIPPSLTLPVTTTTPSTRTLEPPKTTPAGRIPASPRPATASSPTGTDTAPSRTRPRIIPPGRDVQDGMAAVVGGTGIELFAPTRTQVLQWRQGKGCSFGYAGAVPGARPGGPITATRDAAGHTTLLYEEAGTTAIRQVQELGRVWSPPATPLRAVFHEIGEPPVPTGGRVPPPAPPVPPVGVPMVATDDTGRVNALALAEDGRLYVSSHGPDDRYGPWRPVAQSVSLAGGRSR